MNNKLFKYKKNYFSFLLSLVLNAAVIFSLNFSYSELSAKENIVNLFPENLVIENGYSYESFKETLKNNYSEFDCSSAIWITENGEDLKDATKERAESVCYIGIDNNFFENPILYSKETVFNTINFKFAEETRFPREAFEDKYLVTIQSSNVHEVDTLVLNENKFHIAGTCEIVNDEAKSIIFYFIPITTFIKTFEDRESNFKWSIYSDIRTSKNHSSDFLTKSKINEIMNDKIKSKNQEVYFYFFAIFLSCLSICVVSCLTLKNRYNEIGIKLAIGAKKSVLVSELMAEEFGVISLGALAGALAGTVFVLFSEAVKTLITKLNAFYLNFSLSLFILSIYLLSSMLFLLVPSLIAVNANIERILKEER